MKLFHTSPNEITKIDDAGRFGEFLCFSADKYVMTAGEYVTYRIEIDEDDIIDASSLLYHEDAEKLQPITERIMQIADCDEDTADELLSQKIYAAELGLDADDSWDIQALTAKAAKLLGFRGVSMQDEQGTCYMIDMLGREDEMERA